jgi:hypothetical protein
VISAAARVPQQHDDSTAKQVLGVIDTDLSHKKNKITTPIESIVQVASYQSSTERIAT